MGRVYRGYGFLFCLFLIMFLTKDLTHGVMPIFNRIYIMRRKSQMKTAEDKVSMKVALFGGVVISLLLGGMFALSVLMFNVTAEEVTDTPEAPKHYANQ